MSRQFFVVAICIFWMLPISAQRRQNPSDEEIAQAQSLRALYPDEDIIILSKHINITFDKNRDGMVEATKNIRLTLMNLAPSSRLQFPLFYDSESEINDFDIIDRSGREVNMYMQDEYLKSEDLFHADYRVKYANLTFALQGVKYTVSAEKKFKDVKYFTGEYISEPYRVLEGKINIHIPQWLDLDIKEFNFEKNASIKSSVTEEKDERIITYSFENAEPKSLEDLTPGPSHLYPHLLFIARSYKEDGTTFPLFQSTANLYDWYNGLVQAVDIDTAPMLSKVQELTAQTATDEEKIKNIYYWVQDHIRYVAFEDGIAGFQPDSPQNVFAKRYGDCKGMAMLTKTMLELAGFDSRLVWIGTDRLAYDYSIPSLSVDNHMICAVILDGKAIFLDGTEKFNRFGEYASRIQNKQALMQSPEGYKVLTVPTSNSATNIDRTAYSFALEAEDMIGMATRTFGSECRVQFQNNYHSFGRDRQSEVLSHFLTNGNESVVVSDIQPFDPENREEDLELQYGVAVNDAVAEFDGTMYVDIDPEENVLAYEVKDRKIDFKLPLHQRKETKVLLKVPDGYAVDALPKNLSISNELIDIQVSYLLDGTTIVYDRMVNFKKRWIRKKDFPVWNDAFEKLKETLNQQITLIKQ
ncbi:transglutaminase-like domain-containing protein [Luteirhabdus pelagi]|uniref:transglutaminase-like domain-containing protein n=1 Tax=Luteirhabdus pelagi TaxID=2792783 RepID=UPI001939D632|nr:transglutaminase-like domain-containing protein [Luteirhabdus pelagi]